MSRVGQLVTSSLSLGEVLQTTVEAITEHLGYSSTGVFLVDAEDPQQLVLRARSDPETSTQVGVYRQSLREGNVGLAARRREAVFVPDVKRDPTYIAFPGSAPLQSELALPLVVSERLLGVLNVESETLIGEDDRAGLKVVADQLGVAIENARLFAATEAALGEMGLLFETSRRMSEAPDVRGVVGAYLEQVALRRRYGCSVFLFTRGEAGEREAIVLLGRWRPEAGMSYPDARYAYFSDFFDPLLDAGQTVTLTDARTDPRVSDTLRAAQQTRPALALIPLMVRGERVGGVSLNYPEPHAWSEADLRPYQVTAAQLASAIDSRQQQQLLQEQAQRMVVLAERQRLSRELHDSVTQLLFSMTLIAQSVGPAMQRDPAEGEARVAKLLALAQRARAEMRALLVELRAPEAGAGPLPDALKVQRQGLVAALREHVQHLAKGALSLRLEAQGYAAQRPELEAHLLRVVQEALSNVVKHAGATRATVTLKADAAACSVTVHDDGRGFDPRASKAGHFGLETMRERAEALGGRLEVCSSPGEGTTITVTVPLTGVLPGERPGERSG